jgi:GNAT superfamily N-acetyltransferase
MKAPGTKAPAMKAGVSTRPVRLPEDGALLMAIYRSTRQREIAAFGWTEDEVDTFVKFQFEAQSGYYARSFPDAEHSVVMVDGTPAGRLLVERSGNEVHVVDISLLPAFQRGGLGGQLVHTLLEEAETIGARVTCQVASGNEARLFWDRLGFVARDDNGAYVSMERPCETSRR